MADLKPKVSKAFKVKLKPGTKRTKSEVSSIKEDETNKNEKKQKLDTFTEIEFKVMLRDTSTVFAGLERFAEEAGCWPEESQYDIVAGFCRSSPDCAEIFQVLEAERRKVSELTTIFRCLERILLRVGNDLQKYVATGQTIVNKFLASSVNKLYLILNKQNKSSHMKSAVKLLVAMVMLNPAAAKAVLTRIDLSRSLFRDLFNRRDTKDKEDVRTCLLRLIVAFLLSGDSEVIKMLVENKDFLGNLFQGLIYDRVETVELVLSTLLEKVVKHPAISKTAKVRLFHERALKDLGQLYHWRGMALWKTQRKDKKKVQEEEVLEPSEEGDLVAQAVHQFLQELCCSFKHGINFYDKFYGTSSRNQNRILSNFLSFLGNQSQSALQQDLVARIVATCPDQLQHFLPNLLNSLSPRPTQKWTSSMAFLIKIYSTLPLDPPVLRSRDRLSQTQLVDALLVTTLPPRQVLNTVFRQPAAKIHVTSVVVWHLVLELVKVLARRAIHVLGLLSDLPDSLRNFQSQYSPDDIQAIALAYRESVIKGLPDTVTVFRCLDRLQEMTTNTSDTGLEQIHDLQVLCGADLTAHLVKVEQVLCLYQDLVPSLLVQNPVGLGKLLKYVTNIDCGDSSQEAMEDQVTMETASLARLYLLKLLAGTDARGLPWGVEADSGRSLMFQLLDMVTRTSAQSYIANISVQLICQLLASTGLFDSHSDELLIWMTCLQESVQTCGNSPPVLAFVSKCFMMYINHSSLYTERLSDLTSEAQAVQDKSDGSASSQSSLNIDASLVPELESLEPEEGEEVAMVTTDSLRYPFCPVLLPAVDVLMKMTSPEQDVRVLLSKVILKILHTQSDPLPLSMLVSGCQDNTFLQCIHDYCAYFIPGKTVQPSTVADSLKAVCDGAPLLLAVAQLEGTNRDTALEKVETMATDDLELVVRQCLLYIKVQTEDQQDMKKLKFLFDVMLAVVRKLVGSSEESSSTVQTNTMSDEFELLQTKQLTREERLIRVFRLILECTVIKTKFLCVEPDDKGKAKSKARLSTSVTTFVKTLFELVESDVVRRDVSLDHYRTRVLQCLTHRGDKTSAEHSTKQVTMDLSLALLAVLINGMEKKGLVLALEGLVGTDLKTADSWRSLVTQVLQRLTVEGEGQAGMLKLSSTCVQQLLTLTTQEADQEDEVRPSVENLFTVHPQLAVLCSEDTFLSLLGNFSDTHSRLFQCLMSQNVTLWRCFGDWLLGDWNGSEGNLDYLPLVVTFLKQLSASTDAAHGPEILECIADTYTTSLRSLCKDDESTRSHGDLLVSLLGELCRLDKLDKKQVRRLEKKVISSISDTDKVTLHQVKAVQLATNYQMAADQTTTDHTKHHAIVKVCIQGLAYCLGSKTHRNAVMETTVLNILTDITKVELEHLILTWDGMTEIWPKLLKTSLKHLYTDPSLLKFLSKLIPVIYTKKPDVPLAKETAVAMVLSHSEFLPTMFNERNPDTKEPLLDLLLELFRLAPQCSEADHIGVYLGSYGATLSQADQKLLKLIQVYEANGVKFTDYRPFLWGVKAIEQNSLRKSLGPSLLKQPTMEQVVGILDRSRMAQTLLNYPLRRKLQPDEVQTAQYCKSAPDCYDPCFLLPLFSQILAPDVVVDCRKFIEYDCLGFTLCALSSHEQSMRSAAYHILDRYRVHLDGSRFHEKQQIVYLMEFLKNSLPSPQTKLACIISLFLARTARLLIHPDDHMYRLINSFLLVKPSLDLLNVPEFYKLFNSSAFEYDVERTWMLSLLAEGLREMADYRIYEKRFIFNLLQSFYDSDLSDQQTQLMVLRVMKAACMDRGVAMDMIQTRGFLTWLTGVVTRLCPEHMDHVSLVVDVLQCLWVTLLGNKEFMRKTSEEKPSYVKPSVTGQTLVVLQALLWKLRDVREQKFHAFITTLSSVLNHIRYTATVVQDKVTRIVFPSLSQADVTLILLHAGRFVKSSVAMDSFLHSLTETGFELTSLVARKTRKVSVQGMRRKNQTSKALVVRKTNPTGTRGAEGVASATEQTVRSVLEGKEEKQRTGSEDLIDSLIQIVTDWTPQSDQPTGSEGHATVQVLSASVVAVCQWLVSQFQKATRMRSLSVSLQWIERQVCSDSELSQMTARTLTAMADIREGLLAAYSKAVALRTSEDDNTVFEQYRKVLDSLNKILSTVIDCQIVDPGRTFLHEGETPGTGGSADQRAVLLQRFFLQTTVTTSCSQFAPQAARKRKGDNSKPETGSSKKKKHQYEKSKKSSPVKSKTKINVDPVEKSEKSNIPQKHGGMSLQSPGGKASPEKTPGVNGNKKKQGTKRPMSDSVISSPTIVTPVKNKKRKSGVKL